VNDTCNNAWMDNAVVVIHFIKLLEETSKGDIYMLTETYKRDMYMLKETCKRDLCVCN